MVVITLTDTPPKIRGDLSKWMLEISTGVYVGNISSRVRDELWARICENIGKGRATIVYSAQCEQHFKFKVYNSHWMPEDFEGIKLLRHPLTRAENEEKINLSAAERKFISTKKKLNKDDLSKYVVIDLETTGLSVVDDRIIEIGAILVENGNEPLRFQCLVNSGIELSSEIIKLTGITPEMIKSEGLSEKESVLRLIDFIGNHSVVAHNANFDFSFLHALCKRNGIKMIRNRFIDTIQIARHRLNDVNNYKLETLGKYFNIAKGQEHRALSDCCLTAAVYEKLKEL